MRINVKLPEFAPWLMMKRGVWAFIGSLPLAVVLGFLMTQYPINWGNIIYALVFVAFYLALYTFNLGWAASFAVENEKD